MRSLLFIDTRSIPRHLFQDRIACRVDLFYAKGILVYRRDGLKLFTVPRERMNS